MKLLAQMPLDEIKYTSDWVCNLHREAFKGIVGWAGQARRTDVMIRNHTPPAWYYVPSRMHQFAQNLEYQASGIQHDALDLQRLAQVFAYSEGEFTNIHPFEDFNGRVSRLLSWSLVLRFGLPAHTETIPRESDEAGRQRTLDSLEAWDNGKRGDLMQLWHDRLVAALTL
jgi:CRISPR-associated endonuclease/helicase Cas3